MKWYLSWCEKAILCCNSNTFSPSHLQVTWYTYQRELAPLQSPQEVFSALHNSWKIEWVILKYWNRKVPWNLSNMSAPTWGPFLSSSHTAPLLPLISDNDSQCSCCNGNKSARICHASWNHWVKFFFIFCHINVFSVRTCCHCAIVFYWHFENIAEV